MMMDPEKSETSEMLFEYLKDSLYNPSQASIDMDAIDPAFEKLAQGIQLLDSWMIEQEEFGKKIAKGDLDTPAPSVENRVASPLKELQGTLNHLTWQAQEVAKGDYSQHVDFMGDLADAFNTMIKQLDEREQALEAERDNLKKANKELYSTHSLMMALAFDAKHAMIVVDRDSSETLYMSESAYDFMDKNPKLFEKMGAYLSMHHPENTDSQEWTQVIEIPQDEVGEGNMSTMLMCVSSHSISWAGRQAIAHLVSDNTEEMEARLEMEDLAFRDPLTRMYNRRYGMDLAETLITQNTAFCLAFIDLDNLKYCNDDFGHKAGDDYILSLVELLQKIDGSPTICRIGGDEFMLLFKETEKDWVEQQLAAKRQDLIDSPLPEGYKYHHSFSYGIVEIPAHAKKTLGEYLAIADQIMYEFKYDHKKYLKISL